MYAGGHFLVLRRGEGRYLRVDGAILHALVVKGVPMGLQMPSIAIGSAVSSMAAKNVGAGLWGRVARVARAGVLFNVVMTGGAVLLLTTVSRPVFTLFLGEASPSVAIAEPIHLVVSWSFVFFGASFVLSSVVRATGAVVPPLLILFVALWVVRIAFAYARIGAWGAEAVWWSFPLGSVASARMTAAYDRFGGWRSASMLGAPSAS